MSASLVGSEMCIRDRRYRGACECPRLGPGPFRSYWPDRKGLGGDRCRSVSYTHLTLPTICSV
eukprot:9496485-Alexandrium_andersonii.AAC.1